MVSALVANIAAIVGILFIGGTIDRYVASEAKLAALPWYLQWVTGGTAISPLVYFQDRLVVGPIDGLIVAFALSIALWIGLPTLFAWVVVTDSERTHSNCWTSALSKFGGER